MFSKQDTHYFSLTWIPELGGVQELAEGEEEGRTLLVPLSTLGKIAQVIILPP